MKLCQCKKNAMVDKLKALVSEAMDRHPKHGAVVSLRIIQDLSEEILEIPSNPCTCQEKINCNHIGTITSLHPDGKVSCDSCGDVIGAYPKKEEYEEFSHLEDLHSFVTTNLKDYKRIIRTELPSKQECDHIVAILDDCGERPLCMRESELLLFLKWKKNDCDACYDNYAHSLDDVDSVSEECPLCKQQIDWDKIKESLKQSNEKE